MAPVRQVSNRQLEILVEFAEKTKDMAINRHNGPLGHQRANKAWEEVGKILNSIGEGARKTPDKWKRYWHLLKCRTKAKAADVRRRSGTGDEPNKVVPLTDLEQRIVWVIGDVAVAGNSAVRVFRIPTAAPIQVRDGHSVLNRAYAFEERRIAAEERLADAVASLSSTNEGILISLQQMAATQAQLVSLLQERLKPPH